MQTKKMTTKTPDESPAYCIFTTDFGPAAIAWRQKSIIGLLLPEPSHVSLLRRVAQSFIDCHEAEPTQPVNKVIKQIRQYFAGQPANFKGISIDLTGCTPFCQTVYEQLCQVPAGSTVSYKDLAAACEKPDAARAIGLAAGRNPVPLLIPCHRVVNADGRLGGFSASGGVSLKARMLQLEGHIIEERPAYRICPPLLISDCNIDGALNHLSRADSDLADLIRVAPRFNLEFNPGTSIFQALLEAIVYQQLTGKAAATIYRRVLALFSGKSEVSALDIIRADEEELGSAGLSRNKVLAIKDLADFAVSGRLPDHNQMRTMSNTAIIDRLTLIRGIGRWTVEMLLIFKLGRADVMAADDYGLRKGLAAIRHSRELPTPTELMSQAEAWKPYRSIASWYLWRAAENYRVA